MAHLPSQIKTFKSGWKRRRPTVPIEMSQAEIVAYIKKTPDIKTAIERAREDQESMNFPGII